MRIPTTRSWLFRATKTKMAIALAFILLLPSAAVATHIFDDVDDNRFYADPVEWAFNNGITTGTSATTFHPDRGVTRGESVTFLKRYHDNMVVPIIPTVTYITETTTSTTSSMAYVPVPTMSTNVTVPAGETWIAIITFSSESKCTQNPAVSAYCFVRALVDGATTADPGVTIFDSVQHGPNNTSTLSWASHSYQWAVNLGPGFHTIDLQYRVDETNATATLGFRTMTVEYYPIWTS